MRPNTGNIFDAEIKNAKNQSIRRLKQQYFEIIKRLKKATPDYSCYRTCPVCGRRDN